MPEKANQSGGISWSHTAVRSQTVEEYKADVANNGARPKPEFWKVGKHVRILTGANVTRKREWTVQGMVLGFWGGFLTLAQTVVNFGFKTTRFKRNAELTAGQKFDGGINKLVEDMVKDKDLLKAKSTFDKTEFEQRVEALYKQAKILQAKGGYSNEEIAERFRVNLMESLRVVQKKGAPGDYEKVLNDLTQTVLPHYKWSVGSPAKDKIAANKDNEAVLDNLDRFGLEEFREQQTFDRSVVLAALRDVETFGCDIKKFEAFGGSRLLHDFYKGDAALMKAFNGDHAAASNFDFDVAAYRTWGGCAPLYKEFGDKPAELEGKKGAAALSDWLDQTYGNGTGAAFLKKHETFKSGVDSKGALQNKGPTQQWLKDLEALREKQNDYDDDQLAEAIKKLVERVITPSNDSKPAGADDTKDDINDDVKIDKKYAAEADQTPDISLSHSAKEALLGKLPAAGDKAGRSDAESLSTDAKYDIDTRIAKRLQQLEYIKTEVLLAVLNEGLAAAAKELTDALNKPLQEFEKDRARTELGRKIQTELEFRGHGGYASPDVMVDNVIYGTNLDLRKAFINFLEEAPGRHDTNAVRAVLWLINLQKLRNYANKDNPLEGELWRQIEKLAGEAMEAGSDEVKDDVDEDILHIPTVFTVPLLKEIAKQAGRQWTEKTTLRESLKLLEDLDQKQLIEVVNNGFAEADRYLRRTLTQSAEDFAKITQERNKNEAQQLFIAKELIDKTYGIDDRDDSKDNRITGSNMVKRRLEKKRTEVLDDQRDRTMIDGQDLRIIEKELYNLGYVRTDANRAPKRKKTDPELQISKSPQPQRNDNKKNDKKKIEIEEETSTLKEVGITENAADSVTSRLTDGLDIHRLKKELENLPNVIREQVDGQVVLLLGALDKVDKGAQLADEAGDIASCAIAIQTAEVLQKKQYTGLKGHAGHPGRECAKGRDQPRHQEDRSVMTTSRQNWVNTRTKKYEMICVQMTRRGIEQSEAAGV